MPTSRQDAWAILNEFTKNPSLIKHALGVESAMRAYAPKYGGNPDVWGVVGLLHDYDYERYPEVGEHAVKGAEILKERGWPQEKSYAVFCLKKKSKRQIPPARELTRAGSRRVQLCRPRSGWRSGA